MRRIGWWALLMGLGALVVTNVPDIQRYLKIRMM
jgi:hypothetical protein